MFLLSSVSLMCVKTMLSSYMLQAVTWMNRTILRSFKQENSTKLYFLFPFILGKRAQGLLKSVVIIFLCITRDVVMLFGQYFRFSALDRN